MATVEDVLREAHRFAGQPYSFGAEVPHSLDPTGVCPVDCSELVEAACRRAGVTISDGAYNQWKAAAPVPVTEAIRTRGALLFYGDGTGTGRDAITHVAFSQGDGTTFEAWKDGLPVGSYHTDGRPWTFAGLIPGVDYEGDDMTPEQAESLAECRRMLAVLLAAQGPAPGTGEKSIEEQTAEIRRQCAVLLGALEPAAAVGELSIPQQLGYDS